MDGTALDSLSDAVDSVADYTATLDLDGLDWQTAIAVNGLLAAERRVDEARRFVDRAIATQTSEGQFDYGYGDYPREWARWTEYDVSSYKPTANPAALGTAVLAFYERTADRRYLDAAGRQYAFFDAVDRTADGGISRRADAIELFTEVVYFLCPWFVRYGQLVDDAEPIDEAIRQAAIHVTHLQDPNTGLFRHIWRETPDSYPQSQFWSRGNGWAAAGLIDTLAALPDDHPDRGDAADALRRHVDRVCDYQDRSGFWHQVLDDPTTPLETSGSLIYAYALQRGVDDGVLDGDRYAAAARDAMAACVGVVDDEGAVGRVSKPPASSMAPLGVTPYGQGWFLLAASRFTE